MLNPLYLGIDVGTGSARAGLFDRAGKLVSSAKHQIMLYRDAPDIAEQSSEDIWRAVCASVRAALATANADPATVAGIGFDATCSLVVVGRDGAPLPVGDPSLPDRNIIVWMDHRATEQARRINKTGHEVLRYVGNRISPEMETPKLLWLKENRPEVFASALHFFDLTDYLTWRSTGSAARSICTTTCKWTYLAHERRWDAGYFREIGLAELADEGFARIGTQVVDPGSPVGKGLSKTAAADMGLLAGTPVAAGLIDAHAGGVGTVGAAGAEATARLAYVFGTSACTMTSTREPAFVPGVWGPYFSAMVPGLWLNEAGQSAAGAAIDHLVQSHPASSQAAGLAKAAGLGLGVWLGARAMEMARNASEVAKLADGLHVVPEYLGNRAPFADPDARAIISGLDMDTSTDSLVRLYVAGVCGLGYGLRQIVDAQRDKGVDVSTIVVSGGAGQSELVRQLLSDATGIEVAAPMTDEPVLLGSAMLAATAARHFEDLAGAMSAMSAMGSVYTPTSGMVSEFHKGRYSSFKRLQSVARELGSAHALEP